MLSGAERNATLKRELERSNSKRQSITGSFKMSSPPTRSKSARKVGPGPLDLLPIVAGDSSSSGVTLPADLRVQVWSELAEQTEPAEQAEPAQRAGNARVPRAASAASLDEEASCAAASGGGAEVSQSHLMEVRVSGGPLGAHRPSCSEHRPPSPRRLRRARCAFPIAAFAIGSNELSRRHLRHGLTAFAL